MNILNKYRFLVLYLVVVTALVINSFLAVGTILISTFIICLILLPFILWLHLQFNKMQFQMRDLKELNSDLEEQYQLLEKNKEDIKYIIDSAEDIAIFSLDKLNNEIHISNAAQRIYGYKQEELLNNPILLKQVIHPEDKESVDKEEQFLLLGETTTAEFRIIRADGKIRWVRQRETPIKDDYGHIQKIIGHIVDITTYKQTEIKLKQMAYYDKLTDLANRILLERHLKKAIARSKRHDHQLGIMFIDLDGFKKVNDRLGHEAGDHLLKEVAKRLNENTREEDLIARLGGDEFIIVFDETSIEEIEGIAQRTLEQVSLPYLIGGNEAIVTPSIGISMFPIDGEDTETLIKNADKAMYYAKYKGKKNFQFYSTDLPDISTKKINVFDKIVNHFQSISKNK